MWWWWNNYQHTISTAAPLAPQGKEKSGEGICFDCMCVCVCVCMYVCMCDTLLVLGRRHWGRQFLPEASHPSDPIFLTLSGLQPLLGVALGSTIFRAKPFGRPGPIRIFRSWHRSERVPYGTNGEQATVTPPFRTRYVWSRSFWHM